jgi:hypothetical protein
MATKKRHQAARKDGLTETCVLDYAQSAAGTQQLRQLGFGVIFLRSNGRIGVFLYAM